MVHGRGVNLTVGENVKQQSKQTGTIKINTDS